MWQDVEGKIHAFFVARGFVHVRTPIVVPTPGMEPNLDPMATIVELTNPRRSVACGLITSPEYSMKKLLGAGMEKIYTVTPVFRNMEALGARNIPEFTMVEWYAHGTYEDLMKETEALLQVALEDRSDWSHWSYRDARVDAFGDPHVDAKRFFVTQYPPEQASLARISPEGYAERFEAFGDGLELCNGFCELTDPVEQRRRFEVEQDERRAMGKAVYPIDEELLAALGRIEDSVYGNALGLDRLVMLKYAIADIREIQLIPNDYGVAK